VAVLLAGLQCDETTIEKAKVETFWPRKIMILFGKPGVSPRLYFTASHDHTRCGLPARACAGVWRSSGFLHRHYNLDFGSVNLRLATVF
jgi:hypothetical protein